MRLSLSARQAALREAHLAREETLYPTIEHASFEKKKDWDEHGPVVIWEGTLRHPELTKPYTVQVHYGPSYPFVRPSVYPVKPRIVNQRHQNPTTGKAGTPGALCLLPYAPDRWDVSLTCVDVVERTLRWLKAYEAGTLGDEFAAPEIELFFPAESRFERPNVLLVESLLGGATGHEGGCILVPTGAGDFAFFAPIFADDSVDKLEAEMRRLLGLVSPCGTLAAKDMLLGEWFALDGEPQLPVPLSSAALMRLLTRSGRSTARAEALAEKKPSFVALIYPTEAGLHWLIFKTDFTHLRRGKGFRAKHLYTKILLENEKHPLKLYPTLHVSSQTIFRRVSGYEVEKLAGKSCLILGCGALGSRIAETIVKSGIGKVTLVDNDTLRAGNVSRHVLGISSLAQNKADALRQHLLGSNPFAEVEAFSGSVVSNSETLESLVGRADLVLSCLGSDPSELFVSAACAAQEKSVIFCRSFLQGRLGQVLIYLPPTHCACYGCASAFLAAPSCAVPRPPKIAYEDLVDFDGDCGSAFIPASAVDLDFVSLQGAQLALAALQGDALSANYWLVRGREFAPGEYTELSGEIREPYRLHGFRIPADASCEICLGN